MCDADTFIDVDFIPNIKSTQRGAFLRRFSKKLETKSGATEKPGTRSSLKGPQKRCSFGTVH